MGDENKKLKCFFVGLGNTHKHETSFTNHTMMRTFTNAITDAAQRELADVVQRLAKHYGFNYIEAMRILDDDDFTVKNATPVKKPAPLPVELAGSQTSTTTTEVKSPEPTIEKAKTSTPPAPAVQKEEPKPKKKTGKYVKPQHALPWTGVVVNTWCKGLRPNGGMLSQCIMAPKSDGFCATCFKQFKSDGKTKCGTVDDRLAADAAGKDYKNPETGKTAVSFGVFIAKQKIKREDAVAEAAKFGIEIAESHFEVPQKRKGRPPSEKPMTKGEMAINDAIKKALATTVSSTSESENEPSVEKMLASPVKEESPPPLEENHAPLSEAKEPHPDYDAETEDEDEVEVVKFAHKGKTYLRDKSTNMIYDAVSQDLVGVYDENKDIIQPCQEVETDDEAEN